MKHNIPVMASWRENIGKLKKWNNSLEECIINQSITFKFMVHGISTQTHTNMTAKSTYRSCKNGHLFACTSLWSVAEGPDRCRGSEMSGIFQDIHVCNYSGRVSHVIRIICIASGRARKSITLLSIINMLWQMLRVCTPYWDRQYFHCGVPDPVPWVLLVSTAKQEPANKNLELIPQIPSDQ